MITVNQALSHLFDLAGPLGSETVDLRGANGRVLAADVAAKRAQPPFDASAMDGYALKSIEADLHAQFKVVGEAAAGNAWTGTVGAGQAIRIFTGAPVPTGADRIVIQENVSRSGDVITILDDTSSGSNIRPAGGDFAIGDRVSAPRILRPRDIALMASMNVAEISVVRRPVIALISTGDELVMPGEMPGPDQIIASNAFGLDALLRNLGAHPRILPIARDSIASFQAVFERAQDADLIVTIGGASVGDHDLVAQAAAQMGLEQSFYKVAMRPGKPLMAGRLHGTPVVGLPGNPVSAMVCGTVFLAPMIRAMLGLGQNPAPRVKRRLSEPLSENGPREHYMRAVADAGTVKSAGSQDSSLLRVLSEANALLIRPPDDPPRQTAERVDVILLDGR